LAQKKTIQPTFSILRLWSEGKGIKPSSINWPNLKSTTGNVSCIHYMCYANIVYECFGGFFACFLLLVYYALLTAPPITNFFFFTFSARKQEGHTQNSNKSVVVHDTCWHLNTNRKNKINETNNVKIQHMLYTYATLKNS
jgi:hypothetical protein